MANQRGDCIVSDLAEKKCQVLVWKLCSSLGWNIYSAPGARYVLLDQTSRRITFGQSMIEVVESLCYLSRSRFFDLTTLPTWMRECSSIEELILKAEVVLCEQDA